MQDIFLPPFFIHFPLVSALPLNLAGNSFNQGLYFCHWRVLKMKIITDQKVNKEKYQDLLFPPVTADVIE